MKSTLKLLSLLKCLYNGNKLIQSLNIKVDSAGLSATSLCSRCNKSCWNNKSASKLIPSMFRENVFL